MSVKILRLVALLTLPAAAHAVETAAFLKIGVGARALAMGGAYTAVAEGASAAAWNPAGLAAASKRELFATHEDRTSDTRFDYASYAQPVSYGVLAAAGTYLSQGSIPGRDLNGAPAGSYSASDQAVTLGFARKASQELRWGANAKYVRSAIADASAQAGALDLGGQYVLSGARGPGVPIFGVAVQNFGTTMRFLDQAARLPLTLAAGAAYRLPSGSTVSMDYKGRPYGPSSEFGVGVEYAVIANFTLRAGYSTAKAYTDSGGIAAAFNGISTGFGVKWRAYALDYSFTPAGELGYVQALSLGARF